MFREYKGIPRTAMLLVYLSFIPGMAIGFIYTDLSYLLPHVDGFSGAQLGATITVMAVSTLLTSLPLGILADRHGRRKMLVLGNLCASVALLGFAFVRTFTLAVPIAIVEGTGEGAFAVSVGALIADLAGDEKRTATFSLLNFLGWISSAAGGFAISSVVLFEADGLTANAAHVWLYAIVGLLNLSVTPLMFKIPETKRLASGEKRKGVLPRKSGSVLAKFSIFSIGIAFGAGLFVPLMADWFSLRYGVTDAVSGPVLGIASLLTAVAIFMSPKIARKFGVVKAIALTEAASILFMFEVPLLPTFYTSAGVYTVRVFLMNLSNPLTQSLIMGLVAPEERGMASGITAALWRFPNAISTFIGAILMGEGLLALPFYLATAIYGVSITAFWFMFRGVRLPEESAQPPASQS